MAGALSVEVVERALAGDPESLTRLVETHQDEMLNLAFRITGDSAASWEIVSEVFLRLLEHPNSVAGREGAIREPLLHGTWALARSRSPRTDELPRDDRAVAAVAAAAMALPVRQRAALALGDLLRADLTLIGAVLGASAAEADQLLSASRLALAGGLGIRGRDAGLVEREAARVYGLWPAEQADPMAPDILEEGERRGLVAALPGLRGDVPVIAGVRITPAVGLALLLVPLLLAAAIAVALRSGGGDGDPVVPATTAVFTDDAFTDVPTTTGTGTTRTGVVSTVATDGTGPIDGGVDPGAGGSDGGSDDGTAEPAPASPTTTAAAPEPATTTQATPTVTRAPGGAAPPRPTTAATTPAPTSTGSAQPPAPTVTEVPLP